MPQALPEIVDAWRMVQSRRQFGGKLALSGMPRLAADLAEPTGEAVFDLEFDKDELGVPYLHVRADAALPLICQRSLERFELPVHIDTRLGHHARSGRGQLAGRIRTVADGRRRAQARRCRRR
jgi:uncharacterized protein